MNYIMVSLIVLILLFGLIDDRNRLCQYFIIALWFIVTCFSYDKGDYLGYSSMYETIGAGGVDNHEVLYVALMRWGNAAGLTYNGFRIIVTAIECVLLHSTIKKYTGTDSMIWALFFLFPGWIITTLARHQLSLAIIIFSLRFLVGDDTKRKNRDTMMYLLCVVIASLIHTAYWMFLVLVLVRYINDTKILLLAVIFAIIVYIFRYTNVLFYFYAMLPIRVFSIDKYMRDQYANINGITYAMLRQIIIISWAYFSCRLYFKCASRLGVQNKTTDHFMRYVMPLNYASVFFLGPMAYAANVSRMNHVIMIINCMAAAVSVQRLKKMTVQRFIPKLFGTGVVILLSMLAMFQESWAVFEFVLKMIFETNDFINAFN